ncbi:MAG: hypothetical protein OEU36_12600 [Gammaproteobacteria bacterium]|nr:hypothetical protein [Gammaproteobacteria bacterium]
MRELLHHHNNISGFGPLAAVTCLFVIASKSAPSIGHIDLFALSVPSRLPGAPRQLTPEPLNVPDIVSLDMFPVRVIDPEQLGSMMSEALPLETNGFPLRLPTIRAPSESLILKLPSALTITTTSADSVMVCPAPDAVIVSVQKDCPATEAKSTV